MDWQDLSPSLTILVISDGLRHIPFDSKKTMAFWFNRLRLLRLLVFTSSIVLFSLLLGDYLKRCRGLDRKGLKR
jgi:hypothetical protein